MTAPTPTSGDSGYSRFMRLDFLVAAGDSCISPRESEQYTALLEFWRVVVARTAAAEEIQSCGGHRQLPSFPRPGRARAPVPTRTGYNNHHVASRIQTETSV